MSAYILSKFFELHLHRSNGNEFQALFNELMTRSHDGFVAVRPWGNHGDRGNDGYIPKELRFFQLFAPMNEPSPTVACTKAVQDFGKLETAYPGLKSYNFVLNDKFSGIPAPIAEQLHKLHKSKPALQECEPMGAHALRKKFEALSIADQEMLVGQAPSSPPKSFDFSALGAVLKELADSDVDEVDLTAIILPAAFDAKAEFNGFSDHVKMQLAQYARRISIVDRMLVARDASWSQAIADEVGTRYSSLPAELDADSRFWELIESIIPPIARGHTHSLKAYREAALLVVAKYFETCDVFENPNSTAAAEAH